MIHSLVKKSSVPSDIKENTCMKVEMLRKGVTIGIGIEIEIKAMGMAYN